MAARWLTSHRERTGPGVSGSLAPLAVTGAADDWRLLVRISQVRWLGIAAAVVTTALSPPAAGRWIPLLLVAFAAMYNGAVALHTRLPRFLPGHAKLITLVGDFAWVTAAGLLAVGHGNQVALIGYVAVGLESGLLFGWRGAAATTVAGVAAFVAFEVAASASPAHMVTDTTIVAVTAMFAAAASSEMRAQHGVIVAASESLARHARTDHLTGLGNGSALDEAAATGKAGKYGLLLVDIDGMSRINGVYGYEAGDELLHSIARVLTSVSKPDDVAVRLAEDKFALLLPGVDRAHAVSVAEQIHATTHHVAVRAGRLRVSIGCAWSAYREDVADTLQRADDALLEAKSAGGDRVIARGRTRGKGRWRLRETVDRILADERGVYGVYQRVVRLSDGVTAGWEALTRPTGWPADTSVEALFLAAHRMGRGTDLDWRCRFVALEEAAPLRGPLFVNVSFPGLLDPVHDVDQLLLLCHWADRSPEDVVLELSERDGMFDLEHLRQVMSKHRAAGFQFAIDDLGEGQTTLEVLLAARAEYLKLGRRLIQAAATDALARAATTALVRFADDTGATVIAEGIEDEAGRQLCLSLGIDLGQGWLFGRPQLPQDEPR